MEEDPAQPADQGKPEDESPKQEAEEGQAGMAGQPAGPDPFQPAKEEAEQQASAMETTAVDGAVHGKDAAAASTAAGSGGEDGRGLKRPAPATAVRAAKQARTTQAAGELTAMLLHCLLMLVCATQWNHSQ